MLGSTIGPTVATMVAGDRTSSKTRVRARLPADGRGAFTTAHGQIGKGSLTRIGKMEGGSRLSAPASPMHSLTSNSLQLPCSSLMKHNIASGRFNLRRHATEAASVPVANAEWRQRQGCLFRLRDPSDPVAAAHGTWMRAGMPTACPPRRRHREQRGMMRPCISRIRLQAASTTDDAMTLGLADI